MSTSTRYTRHRRIRSANARGIALVELLLAIAITSMITAAVASITTAVARSHEHETDRRETTVRSQALNVRLSGYITPSMCFLESSVDSFVLWLEDVREGETVHASEIRWVSHNAVEDTIELHYLSFPEEWTQIEIDEYDVVFPVESDWWAVRATYADIDLIETIRLADKVGVFSVNRDDSTEQGQKIMTFRTTFNGQYSDHDVLNSASIREYQEPSS